MMLKVGDGEMLEALLFIVSVFFAYNRRFEKNGVGFPE